MAAFTKTIQQDLFKIGSSLATPNESPKPQIVIDPALADRLTDEVHRIEAIEGMLADWSIPGEHRAAAAFDVARTVCRRAERAPGAAAGGRRDRAASDPGVHEPTVRLALAVRPQARTRCRCQRLPARGHRQGRQPLFASLVGDTMGASERMMHRLRAVRVARDCRAFAAPRALAQTPARIVSTSPSITETLFALGLGDRVVGVSTYCRSPEACRCRRWAGFSSPMRRSSRV